MSKGILKLENPILINNEEVAELTYDPQKITAEQFSVACAKSAALNKTQSFTFKMMQNDYSLHLYLGMMAVIAENPKIDISDLERIHGFDVLSLTQIGTFFTLRRRVEISTEIKSEKPSETTADTTM